MVLRSSISEKYRVWHRVGIFGVQASMGLQNAAEQGMV